MPLPGVVFSYLVLLEGIAMFRHFSSAASENVPLRPFLKINIYSNHFRDFSFVDGVRIQFNPPLPIFHLLTHLCPQLHASYPLWRVFLFTSHSASLALHLHLLIERLFGGCKSCSGSLHPLYLLFAAFSSSLALGGN